MEDKRTKDELLAEIDSLKARLGEGPMDGGGGMNAMDLLQAIIDNSHSVIYIKDADGRFLFMNRFYAERFKGGKVVGKTDHDIFPKEIADTFRANDKQVLEAGRALEFEDTALEPDGKLHTYFTVKFPIPGLPGAVCGISTDITEKKRAEEELRKSDERLREAQAMAHIGNWNWDITGNSLYWSDEVYRIFGPRSSAPLTNLSSPMSTPTTGPL